MLKEIQDLPQPLGMAVLWLSYALCVTAMLPGTPFNLGAGYLYGFGMGGCVALLGGLAGALGAFWLGRFLVREWATERMQSEKKFKALDKALQTNAFQVVFLMRLSPILPFPLLSYIFGVTQIDVNLYITGTLIGMIPSTFLETYLGQEMASLSEALHNPQPESTYWLILVSFATLFSLVFVSFLAHRALNSALSFEDNNHSDIFPKRPRLLLTTPQSL